MSGCAGVNIDFKTPLYPPSQAVSFSLSSFVIQSKSVISITMATDLKSILTPSLFQSLAESGIPFSKTEPLDFNEVGRHIFMGEPPTPDPAWPALKILSEIGLDNMPDMMEFLPPPTSPKFPIQCLGLQMLLDQGPRRLKGVDGRWTNSYFDPVSHKLARSWYSLPPEQRPDTWTRWKGTATLDYWIVLRLCFGAPLVHNGTREGQEIGLRYTEETRATVEQETGQTDPNRQDRDSILSDVYGFQRLFSAGPPQGDDVTAASWGFWLTKLMDVHKPIIDRFGRYPYRNAVQGLISTEEEKKWLEETHHFGEAPPDVAKRVREDVEAGRWTPLGEARN